MENTIPVLDFHFDSKYLNDSTDEVGILFNIKIYNGKTYSLAKICKANEEASFTNAIVRILKTISETLEFSEENFNVFIYMMQKILDSATEGRRIIYDSRFSRIMVTDGTCYRLKNNLLVQKINTDSTFDKMKKVLNEMNLTEEQKNDFEDIIYRAYDNLEKGEDKFNETSDLIYDKDKNAIIYNENFIKGEDGTYSRYMRCFKLRKNGNGFTPVILIEKTKDKTIILEEEYRAIRITTEIDGIKYKFSCEDEEGYIMIKKDILEKISTTLLNKDYKYKGKHILFISYYELCSYNLETKVLKKSNIKNIGEVSSDSVSVNEKGIMTFKAKNRGDLFHSLNIFRFDEEKEEFIDSGAYTNLEKAIVSFIKKNKISSSNYKIKLFKSLSYNTNISGFSSGTSLHLPFEDEEGNLRIICIVEKEAYVTKPLLFADDKENTERVSIYNGLDKDVNYICSFSLSEQLTKMVECDYKTTEKETKLFIFNSKTKVVYDYFKKRKYRDFSTNLEEIKDIKRRFFDSVSYGYHVLSKYEFNFNNPEGELININYIIFREGYNKTNIFEVRKINSKEKTINFYYIKNEEVNKKINSLNLNEENLKTLEKYGTVINDAYKNVFRIKEDVMIQKEVFEKLEYNDNDLDGEMTIWLMLEGDDTE